ncbi:MAG: PEGA domain-containing protein [Fibromonadaceae bacterium]|nr:PEGA domain-containing protein [Fibromonadaceae bacterium]
MNIFRLMLPVLAFALVFSVNAFADDEEFAPRGGTGTVTIITDPPNSDIFLDGVPLGKSPITKKEFRSGPLRLIVMDQGKELINVRFNVWPGRENKFEGATVMPHGTIIVTTVPDKCQILLDGDHADNTDGGPLTINNIDAGSHTIAADRCGRYFEIMVPVRGEKTTEVHLDVRSRKATAKIDGENVLGATK